MSASSAASPLDALASVFDEWKYGPGKNLSIIRSSSSIVSVAASSLLVWILVRSRNGISTTYHRLLLGLSITDILYSFSQATFGAVVPNELDYVVWNARGSQASCDAFGFTIMLGGYSGVPYMCSLNLYYLAKVKFNKTDTYITKKLEPWLHLVPTLFGMILSILLLAKQGMNTDIRGYCTVLFSYEPPHCNGYEDGDTPEGFEIPCGRGRGAALIFWIPVLITGLLAPIIMGGSLLTIYQSVSRAERRIARYGAGALQIANDVRRQRSEGDAVTTDVEGGDDGGGGAFSIMSSIRSTFSWRASRRNSDNQDSSQSRAVLQKAAAYTLAYFVTWTWMIVAGFLTVAGTWSTDFPPPKWQIAYSYVWSFFNPLQGLWTFLIYLQPDIINRKRSSNGNISWFRAFADALWSAVTGRTNSTQRGSDMTSPRARRAAAVPGHRGMNPAPAPGPGGRKTSAAAGSTDRRGDHPHAEAVGLERANPREEKSEVREDDPSV